MAGEGFVDRVVHHLVHQVVQTTRPGGADVHARALAHRLQAFQHLDLLGAVGGLNFGGFAHGFRRGHALLPQKPVGKRGKGDKGAQRPCLKAQSTTDAIEKLLAAPQRAFRQGVHGAPGRVPR